MWDMIAEYGKWLVGPLGLVSIVKLIWEAIISIPLRRLDQRKMKVMVELDLQKQAQIDYLTEQVNQLRKSAGLPEISSGSPDTTPISTTTPTSRPAGPPETGSPNSLSTLQKYLPFGSE